MIRRVSLLALVIVPLVSLAPHTTGQGHAVEARFASPADGPFPTDWFTVPDHTQMTHRRVSLPMPDCEIHVSDCEDIAVLNELDGFNPQPRMSVRFTGPIDPRTVTSETVFLVSLGSTAPGGDMPAGTKVGIDQVVWDALTSALYVESDALLAQHTRFALIVTTGLCDDTGSPVQASDDFKRFRTRVRDDYKQDLLDALAAARQAGVEEHQIAVASVFTTMSVTAVLEKIREQIHAAVPEPADFVLGPNDDRTVFSLADVAGISSRPQTLSVSPYFAPPAPVSLDLVRNVYPGAVGTIAFGKYTSPDYEVHPTQVIPPVGTRSGTPVVQATNDIYFNLFLPAGPEPPNGWPVAIYGHGINANKNTAMMNVASSMAKHGIATIGINAVAHGQGSLGTLTVTRTDGTSVTFSAGGRGIDQNGDGVIDTAEGLTAARPRSIEFHAAAYRQTAIDLMQLVRVIETGVDVDGDSLPDLDASRICYIGNSLGGGYGTLFFAVEPAVQSAVLNVPADEAVLTLSVSTRFFVGTLLQARRPSLLNSPGAAAIDGVGVGKPYFNENMPLKRGMALTFQLSDGTAEIVQSPVVNTAAGAAAIQDLFDWYEWASMDGSPLGFAPLLRSSSLRDLPRRPVLFQLAKGDQRAQGPSQVAIVRAADAAESTLYYLHDVALATDPTLLAKAGKNPHGFLVNIAAFGAIAIGAQEQAARFFESNGADLIHPEPAAFFVMPIPTPLPEGLNYIR